MDLDIATTLRGVNRKVGKRDRESGWKGGKGNEPSPKLTEERSSWRRQYNGHFTIDVKRLGFNMKK